MRLEILSKLQNFCVFLVGPRAAWSEGELGGGVIVSKKKGQRSQFCFLLAQAALPAPGQVRAAGPWPGDRGLGAAESSPLHGPLGSFQVEKNPLTPNLQLPIIIVCQRVTLFLLIWTFSSLNHKYVTH